jgi:hypothetical protein
MHKYAALTALAIVLNITVLTPAVSASLTPANAATPYCGWGIRGGFVWVRAGTPCVTGLGRPTEIIEPPHNGTAVVRADGSIYYSPRPGFTGGDSMRVRLTNWLCQNPKQLQDRPPPLWTCYEIRRLGFRVE